jgi:hypothetical protein
MIHVFNATTDEYELIESIDEHSTSIIDAKIIKSTVGIKTK